jgi:phenylpropionate dioxygenase-like ring-hydroxylating dioxygenase large terminal subunit
MRHERQVELLQRLADAGEHLHGLHAPASVTIPSSTYTDAERFQRERDVLFRRGPTFFALSGEVREPGNSLTFTVGGIPIAVVRQPDGTLRALVNICRHRGAPVVTAETPANARSFTCPYHGWVYGLDGALRGAPLSAGAFDDVEQNCDLLQVAVAEAHGMIFVRAGSGEPIDVDAFLDGSADDLASYGLEHYVPVETRTAEWRMNWKLAVDTFTESYHIRTLHKQTLGPYFNSDCLVFEPFGRHFLAVGVRKDVLNEMAKPVEERALLPYATMQHFLVPNGIVVHQLDHVETWHVEPIDVRTCRLTTSIFAPSVASAETQRERWTQNLDLLLQVTGTEDFPMMMAIQENLDAGAVTELVHGRIEPPLIHFHRVIDEAQRADVATPL